VKIGAQQSVAGGLHLAFARGEDDGCEALQVFTSYTTRWAPRLPDAAAVSRFRAERERCRAWAVMSHAIYLVNLASAEEALRRRSIEVLHEEMLRCEALDIDFLVLHPGSHGGDGARDGIRRLCRALDELHRRSRGLRLKLLLENTAGQGHCLGGSLVELARILTGCRSGDRLGFCFDTCHAWSAGYDLASDEGYEQTLAEADRLLGLDRLRAFHLNDSLRPRGSHGDRHACIGGGTIGRRAFARLVSDPRFADRPGVLETPPEQAGGRASWARDVRVLKQLRRRACSRRR
jgi:deoxyribonuclease IV